MRTTKSTIFGAAIFAALLALPLTAKADDTATVDITPQLQQSGLDIAHLRGIEVGGIVILRGQAIDVATAAQAAQYATHLGYARVANLIQVVAAPDDAAIRRNVERKLSLQRSLEGCDLRVASQKGVVTIAGKIASELQRDVALDVARNIDGVRAVKTDLSTPSQN